MPPFGEPPRRDPYGDTREDRLRPAPAYRDLGAPGWAPSGSVYTNAYGPTVAPETAPPQPDSAQRSPYLAPETAPPQPDSAPRSPYLAPETAPPQPDGAPRSPYLGSEAGAAQLDGAQRSPYLGPEGGWGGSGTPDQQAPRHEPPSGGNGRKWLLIGLVAALVLVLLAGAGQWLRPVPEPTLQLNVATQQTFEGSAPTLPMPTKGQAVVDVSGLGTMASSGTPTPTPTASVAKVMTSYIFLRDHPVGVGQNGPTFTISPAEAARLQWRINRGESHVNVTANEPFTEREALEALLIVSANNIAHEMARWDAGGDAAFVEKMNATAKQLGMTGTTYTDPSGYDSTTVSTAADQVKLLEAAMRIPVWAEIAAMKSYDKVGDTEAIRPSTNALLGVDGVVAGKTGYTDAAGCNFVFAARKKVNGVSVLIVGAVMAQSGVSSSEPTVAATKPLIEAAESALTSKTLVAKGGVVGEVDPGLGAKSPVVAASSLTVVGWPGLTVRLSLNTGKLPDSAAAGTRLATISLGRPGAPAVPVQTPGGFSAPSLVQRLTRLG